MKTTHQSRRDLHGRAITLLIGCALLLSAFAQPVGLLLQTAFTLAGGLFVGAGMFGSVQAILPAGKWVTRLDSLVFAASDMARALDDLASRENQL